MLQNPGYRWLCLVSVLSGMVWYVVVRVLRACVLVCHPSPVIKSPPDTKVVMMCGLVCSSSRVGGCCSVALVGASGA